MKLKFRLKKRYIVLIIIALLLFLLLFFLSSIIRWYVVKNSEDLVGRKIDLAELHINYFKASVSAHDFVMYEQNKQDTFVSFKELYVNFDPWQLLSSTYAFSEIRLVQPVISVSYNDSVFNFDDLITSSDTTETDTISEVSTDTTRYLVRNISISGGYVRYNDKAAGNTIELNRLGINIPEISWNSSKSEMGISFVLGPDGKVSLGGEINQAEGLYDISVKTENIDIEPFKGYAAPYMAVNTLKGRLYTDMHISGDMNNPLNIKVFGSAGLNQINITDTDNIPFFTAANVHVVIDSLDIGQNIYNIRSLHIESPSIIAELDPQGTNFDRIFAPFFADTLDTDTDEADSLPLHYALDTISISGGLLAFTDFTLNRPFKFEISKLNYTMTGFSDTSIVIPMTFSMALNKSGSLNGKAVIDMNNTDNIFFDGSLTKLELQSFSPYSEYYLARPITKGAFSYDCYLKMTPKSLDNKNNIRISNLTLGKKTKDTSAYKVPVGLALYVLKDRNGNILIDLPVSGNPSNPSFKLKRIIFNTLEEFLIKAATEPFRAIGNLFGSNPESIKSIPFDLLQDSLQDDQIQKLTKLNEIIQKKPELTFTFIQTTDPQKEKQLLALRETAQMYIAQTDPGNSKPFTNADMDALGTNAAFKAFLGISPEASADSLYAGALLKAGQARTDALFSQLLSKREKGIKDFFLQNNIPEGTVAFKIADLLNIPDEMKTPKFLIEISLK